MLLDCHKVMVYGTLLAPAHSRLWKLVSVLRKIDMLLSALDYRVIEGFLFGYYVDN